MSPRPLQPMATDPDWPNLRELIQAANPGPMFGKLADHIAAYKAKGIRVGKGR